MMVLVNSRSKDKRIFFIRLGDVKVFDMWFNMPNQKLNRIFTEPRKCWKFEESSFFVTLSFPFKKGVFSSTNNFCRYREVNRTIFNICKEWWDQQLKKGIKNLFSPLGILSHPSASNSVFLFELFFVLTLKIIFLKHWWNKVCSKMTLGSDVYCKHLCHKKNYRLMSLW